MIQRPPEMGAYQFVVLAALRAAQLMKGCTPRVDGPHKAIVIAQLEVAQGKVAEMFGAPVAVTESGIAPLEHVPAIVTS